MSGTSFGNKLVALMLISIAVFWSTSLFGQGCAMCNTSVTQSTMTQQAKGTLNRAVLILLIPPVAMFVGIFFVAYRKRNSFRPTPPIPRGTLFYRTSDKNVLTTDEMEAVAELKRALSMDATAHSDLTVKQRQVA